MWNIFSFGGGTLLACTAATLVATIIVLRKRTRESGSKPAEEKETESKSDQAIGTPEHSARVRYKVMTYNILAPDYANPAWFVGTNRGQLRWSNRQPKLFDQISEADADLLCLQEVQHGRCRREFEAFLHSRGYDTPYSMKCDHTGCFLPGSMTLGVLACWKRHRFRMIGTPRTISLSQYVTHLFDGETFYASGNFQVAIATLLEELRDDSQEPRYILLMSVHMMAPRHDSDYRRKYEQLVQSFGLLQAITDLKLDLKRRGLAVFTNPEPVHDGTTIGCAQPYVPLQHQTRPSEEPLPTEVAVTSDSESKQASLPSDSHTDHCNSVDDDATGNEKQSPRVMLVLAGDFNSPPTSASCELLKHGGESARKKIQILQQLFIDKSGRGTKKTVEFYSALNLDCSRFPTLVSAFEDVTGEEPQHTNFTANFRDCIDYIFLEQPRSPTAVHNNWLKPVEVVSYPHFDLVELFRGTPQRSLPSDQFPSDHLPVIVTLEEV